MRKLLSCLAIASLLSACGHAYYGPSDATGSMGADAHEAAREGRPFVVMNCTGGSINESTRQISLVRQSGAEIRIIGHVASACVALLAIRRLCYAADAHFIFHGPANADGSRPLNADGSRADNTSIRDLLPPRLRAWSRATGAQDDPAIFHILTGAEIAALDDTPRLCAEEKS